MRCGCVVKNVLHILILFVILSNPKFYERDLQHICAGYNSEHGRTCEHICLFVDNRDWNAPIVLRMCRVTDAVAMGVV